MNKCSHEPVNGKWNVWETESGKKYFRRRFCDEIVEAVSGREMKAKSAYQRSVDWFKEQEYDRHCTDGCLLLIPNKMREHYKKWRDACTCSHPFHDKKKAH